MDFGAIMMIETWVMIGVFLVAAMIVGIMFLHHYLRKKEMMESMEMMKTKVLPEMEEMTNRMLDNVMNKTTEAMETMMKGFQDNL